MPPKASKKKTPVDVLADEVVEEEEKKSSKPTIIGENGKSISKKWLPKQTIAITPTRKSKAVAKDNSMAHQAWKMRCDECTGKIPIMRVDENGKPMRRSCGICDMTTTMFCLGCKRFLCVDKDRSEILIKNESKVSQPEVAVYQFTQLKMKPGSGDIEEVKIYGTRSCFHIGHEHALDEAMKDRYEAKSHYTTVLDEAAGNLEDIFKNVSIKD